MTSWLLDVRDYLAVLRHRITPRRPGMSVAELRAELEGDA